MIACGWFLFPSSLCQTPPSAAPTFRAFAQPATVAVVFCYFIVLGVATVMLGPALPLLAARWSMPDASLGSLFIAYFAGQFCGSWLATPKLRTSLLLGAIVAAFGMLLLTFAGATAAHVALFCAGLGLGAGLTAGNVVVGTLDAGASEQDPAGIPTSAAPRARAISHC